MDGWVGENEPPGQFDGVGSAVITLFLLWSCA